MSNINKSKLTGLIQVKDFFEALRGTHDLSPSEVADARERLATLLSGISTPRRPNSRRLSNLGISSRGRFAQIEGVNRVAFIYRFRAIL